MSATETRLPCCTVRRGWVAVRPQAHARGPLCVVTAPDIAPMLPVGFDSAEVRVSAESGW